MYLQKGVMVEKYKSWGIIIIFILRQAVFLDVLDNFVKKTTPTPFPHEYILKITKDCIIYPAPYLEELQDRNTSY